MKKSISEQPNRKASDSSPLKKRVQQMESDQKVFPSKLAKSESQQQEVNSAATAAHKAEINSVLENLKRQIEERKKALANPVASGRVVTLKDVQPQLASQLDSKSVGATLLHHSLQEQSAQRVQAALRKADPNLLKETALRLKLENTAGAVESAATGSQAESGRQTVKTEKSQQRLSHYDTRVKMDDVPMARKPPRLLTFNTPGKYVSMANNIRTKEKLEKLQQHIQTNAKKTGIAAAAKLAMVTMRHDAEPHNIPNMEWWDSAIIPAPSYNAFLGQIKHIGGDTVGGLQKLVNDITSLIEHPIEQMAPDESRDIHMPLFLTAKEKKKIRTQRRRAREIEKQEKIRVGLEAPPPPKVKISNLMRVLGSEAVQDPTKVEAHVREQIAARLKAHEQANAARKLTSDQRRQKKIKKLKESTTLGVHTAVYRVWDLANPSKKFKVTVNAQQLYLTGCTLLIDDMNLVIVEGGPKAQNRFKKLMLTRVKWDQDVIGRCATHADRIRPRDENSRPNKCELVWEGINRKRNFQEFKVKQVTTDIVAREFLKKHNCEHYWDLAYTLSLDHDVTNKA